MLNIRMELTTKKTALEHFKPKFEKC